MADVYQGREQTAAKHFILKSYLQALSFKLLHGGYDILTYVDGFSGPWQSKSAEYADTSFMIAVTVLKDAQERLAVQGKRCKIQCFFVEEDTTAFNSLTAAVAAYNKPDFVIQTFNGRFDEAVERVMNLVGRSFALTFIDPTGWTGYEFDKIERILSHQPGEVLLNYMKSFIDRFTARDVHKNANFEGILGRGWPALLDQSLPRAVAVQRQFNEQFRKYGKFKYVLSTPIEKIEDRTAFCIVYGTRNDKGLETYRDVEFAALREHGMRRIEARQALNEARTGMADLFTDAAITQAIPIEQQVPQFCQHARDWLVAELRRERGARLFHQVWIDMLSRFTIRRTNARDICRELANEGIIRATWRENGSRRQKPDDGDLIKLVDQD